MKSNGASERHQNNNLKAVIAFSNFLGTDTTFFDVQLKEQITSFLDTKIKNVEYKVKDVLTNGNLLLKFATLSVIGSLRRKPELYNLVLNDISNNNNSTIYASNYHSLALSEQEQPFRYISDDGYTALILEQSEKLYNALTTKLTNDVIAAMAAAIRTSSSSSLSLPSNNNQN